jgi:hypothetical protein
MNDREELMTQVRKRYALVREGLDERGRRQVLAAEALAIGWGGVRLVAEATGVARATITLGTKERRGQVASAPAGRQRRPWGGRKAIAVQDHLGEVAQAQLVAQAPQHNKEGYGGRRPEIVDRRAGPLAEGTLTGGAAEHAIAERGLLRESAGCEIGTMGTGHRRLLAGVSIARILQARSLLPHPLPKPDTSASRLS